MFVKAGGLRIDGSAEERACALSDSVDGQDAGIFSERCAVQA